MRHELDQIFKTDGYPYGAIFNRAAHCFYPRDWEGAGAKQRFMTSYKEMYPRRSASREEMRNYGWIDMKRK